MALRDDKWKIAFAEQRAEGMRVWSEPLVKLRLPLLFNLRSDPFEKAQHESEYYRDWQVRRIFLLVLAQAFVAQWISCFKEFPPCQKPASFSIDEVMIWSFAGPHSRADVNSTFLQPFVSYTTKTYTPFGLNTESTYDWANSQWTVPINVTVSQLLKIGGPDWGLRFTVRFLFPK